MDNIFEVVENKNGELLIRETKVYSATRREVERELQNIKFNKESLIESSRQLAKDFERLSQRENELKKALSNMNDESESHVIEPLTDLG